jgi:PKD repeat protein
VIQGSGPPGATLRLRKEFDAPTSQSGLTVHEVLNTTMAVPASGQYEWHVNPSSRPDVDPGAGRNPPAEVWTMTCRRAGSEDTFSTTVSVNRGQEATVNWASACGDEPPQNAPPVADFEFSPTSPLVGQQVNFFSTSTDPDGAIATTHWDLDDDGQFDDATGLVASRSFSSPGAHDVSVRVTDDDGAADTETHTVSVSSPSGPRCRGKLATITGTAGDDRRGDALFGTRKRDVIATLGGDDEAFGRGGKDLICGRGGADVLRGGPGPDSLQGGRGGDLLVGRSGRDLLLGNLGADRLRGGRGRDRCKGGSGPDATSGCP